MFKYNNQIEHNIKVYFVYLNYTAVAAARKRILFIFNEDELCQALTEIHIDFNLLCLIIEGSLLISKERT